MPLTDEEVDATVDAFLGAMAVEGIPSVIVARAYDATKAMKQPRHAAIRAAAGDETMALQAMVERAVRHGTFGDMLTSLRVTSAMAVDVPITSARAEAHAAPGEHQAMLSGGGLQPVTWINALHPVLPMTGLIMNAQHSPRQRGTGFLIGPDLLMTAAHVVWPAIDHTGPAPSAEEGSGEHFHFELHNVRGGPDGGECRRIRFAREWLVAASPPCGTPPDLNLTDEQLAVTNLDYVVVRLEERIGGEVGFIDVTGHATLLPPNRGSQLAVIGHAGGSDCRYHIHTLEGHDDRTGRLRHRVNAVGGMSGGPCLTLNGRVVGMHEGTAGAGAYNRSVSMRHIRRHMQRSGDPLEGGRTQDLAWLSPARSREVPPGLPPARPDAFDRHPVFGRAAFLAWVNEAQDPRSNRRLAVISGPEGSGKTFTGDILKTKLDGSRSIVATVPPEMARSASTTDIISVLHSTLRDGAPTLATTGARPDAGLRRHDLLPTSLDDIEAAMDAVRAKVFWVFVDFGNDGGWLGGSAGVWTDFLAQATRRSWLRIIVVGVSLDRQADLAALLPSGGGAFMEEVDVVAEGLLMDFVRLNIANDLPAEDQEEVIVGLVEVWRTSIGPLPPAERGPQAARLVSFLKDSFVAAAR